MHDERKRASSYVLYLALILVAVISSSYYLAGAFALREEFFHNAVYAASPFEFHSDSQRITGLRKNTESAGLKDGDFLLSLNGVPYTGETQKEDFVRRSKPGEVLRATVRTASGEVKQAQIRMLPRDGPGFTLGGYIAFLIPVLGVPLLSLIVGYWVVAARPRDPNAWLVLWLLIWPETAFGNLDVSFWPYPWYLIFRTWHFLVQGPDLVVLLWFGIYFPERWRMDRRWPGLKWVILGLAIAIAALEFRLVTAHEFDAAAMSGLVTLEVWTDRVDGWLESICVVLFLIALFDKLHSSSTPDARRRLRVLAIGSALSLVPLLIIFTVVPLFGMDPHNGYWFTAVIPIVVIFPLTLAYVLIVQRAMDLRILLRLGTRYLLARATLLVIEIALGCFVLLRFVIPMFRHMQHEILNFVLLALAVGGLLRLALKRGSVHNRLRRWIDHKFFREDYDSEVVLNELSDQTRQFTDKGPLIETVMSRLSEVLHVSQLAVWLRGGNQAYHLQQAIGIDLAGPVLLLQEQSATVQNLISTNRPATLYGDRPEAWFAGVHEDEREILRRVNAELLLPLPGRSGLMGLLALGPKKSEQPFTSTDMRVLQSLAVQTGLALEVSELVQSLAHEASQRVRVEREMEIASEVQQRLFPQRIPQINGVELAGMCRPAQEVGGDYYDLIELGGGKLGLAIGDISGKGISAALLMAGLRASLRGLTVDGPGDLARTMQHINRLIFEASARNRYATFFFATYDTTSRELHYANAGHNPPLLVRGASEEVLHLAPTGIAVGLVPFTTYEARSVILESGDRFIGYTDGISEAMNLQNEEWGDERMLAAVPASPDVSAADILQMIFRKADEFTAGAEQHDDMTLLIMRIAG